MRTVPLVVVGVGLAIMIVGAIVYIPVRSKATSRRALVGFGVVAAGWIVALVGVWLLAAGSPGTTIAAVIFTATALLYVYYFVRMLRNARPSDRT